MKLIKKIGTRKNKTGDNISYGLFLCSYCLQEVERQLSNGKRQTTCGKKRCSLIKHNQGGNNPNYKHGGANTKLYKVYNNMKQRCYNPNHKAYKYYGARGIKVCDEWLNKETGFISFRDCALCNGYKEELTIDRHPNNDGDYEPENCRWITQAENNRNRRKKDEIKNHYTKCI